MKPLSIGRAHSVVATHASPLLSETDRFLGWPRYPFAFGVEKAPGRFGHGTCVSNTHACRYTKVWPACARQEENLSAVGKIDTVVGACNAERARQPTWTIGAQIFANASCGLSGANEHSVPLSFLEADNVEAIVHAINEIHIRVALGAQQRSRALGKPCAGV